MIAISNRDNAATDGHGSGGAPLRHAQTKIGPLRNSWHALLQGPTSVTATHQRVAWAWLVDIFQWSIRDVNEDGSIMEQGVARQAQQAPKLQHNCRVLLHTLWLI